MTGYSNPVIPGFHPDPSVCRVGDEFFLVSSTFTWFTGVPIFRSRNLVDWEAIGHVLDRPSQLDLSRTDGWSSLGVFAPTIRHHDGRFWMITTNVTDAGAHNVFVTAEDPAGPWSEPTFLDVAGIDPDLAWDDDGNCWVHHSRGPEVDRRPPGPAAPVDLTGRDDFEGPDLDLRWIAVRRLPSALSALTDRHGWLTLHGGDATLDDHRPVLVGRRQQHHFCRARALVDPGSATEAGLNVYLDHSAHYEVAVRGDRIVAHVKTGPFDVELGSAQAPGGPVVLRLETRPHPHGSDTVTLGFEHEDGTVESLGEIDGRDLSTEMTGGFLGRVLGLYAVGGAAAVDWFDDEELT